MKIPKIAEALGDIDYKYLQESEDYSRPKIRIKTALIAAAAIAVICGITAVAASSGLFRLGQFFEKFSHGFYSDEKIFIGDPIEYGSEAGISVFSDNLSATVTSVACDRHFLAAVIEVDASACDGIPNGILPIFRWYGDNCDPGTVSISLLSHEDSVYTFGYADRGFSGSIDDGVILRLSDFGYYPSAYHSFDSYVVLSRDELVFEIPAESLNILESVSAKKTMNVEGLEIKMELSPLGILLTYDYSDCVELGFYDDKYFADVRQFELHMLDGRHYGDGMTYDSVYNLFSSENGWRDRDNPDIYYTYIGFTAPVDISQVEHIVFRGVDFDFETEVTND